MVDLSEKAKQFLAQQPTLLATIGGYGLYECPVYGDEGFIMAITPNGRLKRTGFIEIPIDDEILDLYRL